jgi:hypothetical protein
VTALGKVFSHWQASGFISALRHFAGEEYRMYRLLWNWTVVDSPPYWTEVICVGPQIAPGILWGKLVLEARLDKQQR